MKQTAVEWLHEKLWVEFGFAFSDNILKQAKEMEKQQIVDAFEADNTEYKDWNIVKLSAEQYYKETFE